MKPSVLRCVGHGAALSVGRVDTDSACSPGGQGFLHHSCTLALKGWFVWAATWAWTFAEHNTFITHYRVSIYSSPSCGFTRSYLPSHFKSPLEAELSVTSNYVFWRWSCNGGAAIAVKVISFGRITLQWEPLFFCELRVWLCKQCIFPKVSFVLLNIRGIFEYITCSQIQRHLLLWFYIILYYSICVLHYIFSKCIYIISTVFIYFKMRKICLIYLNKLINNISKKVYFCII